MISSILKICGVFCLIALLGCRQAKDEANLREGEAYLLDTSSGRKFSIKAQGDDFSFFIFEKAQIYPVVIYLREKGRTAVTTTRFAEDGGEVTIRDIDGDGIPEFRMTRANDESSYVIEKLSFNNEIIEPRK